MSCRLLSEDGALWNLSGASLVGPSLFLYTPLRCIFNWGQVLFYSCAHPLIFCSEEPSCLDWWYQSTWARSSYSGSIIDSVNLTISSAVVLSTTWWFRIPSWASSSLPSMQRTILWYGTWLSWLFRNFHYLPFQWPHTFCWSLYLICA